MKLSIDQFVDIVLSSKAVALTAPLVLEETALIGICTDDGLRSCVAEIPISELGEVGEVVYVPTRPHLYIHGLKRIWEYLNISGHGIKPNLITDTRLIAFLLNPDSGDEGLTLSHLGREYLEEEYPYGMIHIRDDADTSAFESILAQDALIIYRLGETMPNKMDVRLYNLYRQLELPLMVILNEMRLTGIGVNGTACQEKLQEIADETERLAEEITGGREIDLASSKEVYRLLIGQGVRFDDPRVYAWKRVPDDVLEEISRGNALVQKILQWRDLQDNLGFLRFAAGQQGVHATWGQTRAATSRIYAREPALQNVKRELRYLFVPAEGYTLIKADYSQAQMRILAHLSGDEELIHLFQEGADVHSATSERLGLNDRDVAKEINFAICFGMQAPALSAKINELKKTQGQTDFVDESTSASFIEGFYAKYPKVRSFFEREWAKLKKLPPEKRVVRSLLGRLRRFDQYPSAKVERQHRITWPQQIEADLIKTATVRLERIFQSRNLDARIVMVIHDALWVKAPISKKEEVKRLMERMMTTAAKLAVPLVVDFKET